jgi:DNA-binding CsgD family transcriptional regulator/quercetin dioxygenase-like cupin family protein
MGIAMTMQARRVVTGHDENGDAVVVSDERLTAVSRGLGAGISGCEMWSTNRMPIDNSAAADAAQRAGFVSHYIHANYVGTGAGTTFRINEFAPGHARFTHRTETADYVVVLSGTIDMELENDEVIHLKPGDVVVQRGTVHTWVNRGSVAAVTAFILIDATPAEVAGKQLRTPYPFERLGARPWASRARNELRATGQTKPRVENYATAPLTPQEREIALLAASGLTNKQIAERLFLSPRTVGGHLHRAFPKLGIATRAALRDALAALP